MLLHLYQPLQMDESEMLDKDEYMTYSSINMVRSLTDICHVCKACEDTVKLNVTNIH